MLPKRFEVLQPLQPQGEVTMLKAQLKKIKRDEAKVRQARWDALSTKEKLAELDARGVKASKQRVKLLAKLQAEKVGK